jgi:hypothetical protein
MLQLKRFTYDTASHSRRKLNHRVAFPMTLDLRECLACSERGQLLATADEAAAESSSRSSKRDALYECVGVLLHEGCAQGGHYAALLRTGFTSSAGGGDANADHAWQRFDDEIVQPVLPESLVEAQGRGAPEEQERAGERRDEETASGGRASDTSMPSQTDASCYCLIYRRFPQEGSCGAGHGGMASASDEPPPSGAPPPPTPPMAILREIEREAAELAQHHAAQLAARETVHLEFICAHDTSCVSHEPEYTPHAVPASRGQPRCSCLPPFPPSPGFACPRSRYLPTRRSRQSHTKLTKA